MANTLNLLSEETFSEKMNLQNALLASIASQSGGIAIDSWADVQRVVRMGLASSVFSIGDQLTCRRGSSTLVWDIIGIDCDTPTDKTKTHSLTLQLHDCFGPYQFDAPEPINPNSDRASFGSNRWSHSAIRQWLNSDGAAGSWWSAQNAYDTAPNYASSAGFLNGIDKDFLAAVGEVDKTTALNSATDGAVSEVNSERFFLLSRSEVYGGNEGSVNEGDPYPYYAENSDLTAPGTDADTNRIKYRSGSARYWWLRSPYIVTSYPASYMYLGGNRGHIGGTHAHGAEEIAPACCIV